MGSGGALLRQPFFFSPHLKTCKSIQLLPASNNPPPSAATDSFQFFPSLEELCSGARASLSQALRALWHQAGASETLDSAPSGPVSHASCSFSLAALRCPRSCTDASVPSGGVRGARAVPASPGPPSVRAAGRGVEDRGGLNFRAHKALLVVSRGTQPGHRLPRPPHPCRRLRGPLFFVVDNYFSALIARRLGGVAR